MKQMKKEGGGKKSDARSGGEEGQHANQPEGKDIFYSNPECTVRANLGSGIFTIPCSRGPVVSVQREGFVFKACKNHARLFQE